MMAVKGDVASRESDAKEQEKARLPAQSNGYVNNTLSAGPCNRPLPPQLGRFTLTDSANGSSGEVDKWVGE